jgi:hypothetical protein
METFNPHSTSENRAVQAWQILVGKAMNRQTVTYLGLSHLMFGHDAAGVLGTILGHIAFWCEEQGLPKLNTIVVGKGRGTPGEGIPLDPAALDAERERVYDKNWYDICPPPKDQLAASYSRLQPAHRAARAQ